MYVALLLRYMTTLLFFATLRKWVKLPKHLSFFGGSEMCTEVDGNTNTSNLCTLFPKMLPAHTLPATPTTPPPMGPQRGYVHIFKNVITKTKPKINNPNKLF